MKMPTAKNKPRKPASLKKRKPNFAFAMRLTIDDGHGSVTRRVVYKEQLRPDLWREFEQTDEVGVKRIPERT